MTFCEYETAAVPEPKAKPPVDGTLVPNVSLHEPGLVGEPLNQPVVEEPFGLAEPFRVALVVVMLEAELVVTVGGF